MNNLIAFKALCILLMKDDPSKLDATHRAALIKWTNQEAVQLGFTDWVDAYHFLP